MSSEPMGERVSALETWVKGHEDLCATRYGELRSDMRWVMRGVIGLLLSIIAWLAIQLWSLSQHRVDAPQLVTVQAAPK